MGNSMLKLRRPTGRLNFNMELPIPVGRNPDIVTVPWLLLTFCFPAEDLPRRLIHRGIVYQQNTVPLDSDSLKHAKPQAELFIITEDEV